MIPRDQLVEIGNFAKPHGIKGEISAHFDFEIMPLVEGFGHLFVEIDGLMVPFFITALRPKGNETLLLTLKGIDSQEAAAALTNKPVYIEASLLPEDADEDGDGMFYLEYRGYLWLNAGGTEGNRLYVNNAAVNVKHEPHTKGMAVRSVKIGQ